MKFKANPYLGDINSLNLGPKTESLRDGMDESPMNFCHR